MNIAIIKSGGKQYKVQKGDKLNIELLDKKEESKIEFDDILNSKKVSAKIIGVVKGPKINMLKFKNKTRYEKRIGHRQKYTKIEILDIK